MREVIDILDVYIADAAKKGVSDKKKGFARVKKLFDDSLDSLDLKAEKTKEMLDRMFVFIEDVFGKDKEMALVVAELTGNVHSAKFIARYGSEKYFENNKQMLFFERHKDIMKEIDKLKSLEQE